ncbi:uncharacterized protein LOC134687947 [Mytilus trossulus]|uniref:uncharacterized protein LOC134687947 n=1 Tax=Mytilus trossulus TaxID=6551 RepID=UPI003005115A
MKVLIILFCLTLLCVLTNGQVCDDLDTDVCRVLSSLYPKMCDDRCLSSICNRFCGNCPVRCYYSRDIVNPSNCSTIVDCPSIDHYCFTSETFADDFTKVYKMGCALKKTCLINVNGGRRSDVVVKGACCGTDKCNNNLPDEIDRLVDLQQQKISEQLSQNNMTSHMSDCFDTIPNCKEYKSIVCGQYAAWSKEHCARFCNICGTSTKTRVILPGVPTITPDCKNMDDNVCHKLALDDPKLCSNDCIANKICPRFCKKCYQCYSCSDIDRLDDCSNTTTCESGKECFQLETLSYDLRPVFRLGCLDESLCQRLGVNPVQSGFGRRQQGLKGGCCKTDLCNTKLINVIPTTTTTVSTSTIVPTQGCSLYHSGSVHGCGPNSAYVIKGHSCYHIGNDELTWIESKNYCKSKCGTLANFGSGADIIDVINRIKSSYNHLDLWVDAVKDSHRNWIWTETNQRIVMETSFYLNKIDGSCGAGHNSNIVTMIPHNCTTLLHPLCETTIT